VTGAFSLSRKEGWRRFTDTPARTRPQRLSKRAIRALSVDALSEYQEVRADWHANFGTIATPQLVAVREELDLIVASNLQDGDRIRGSAVIDGQPGLGKTTIANLFARDYDRAQRRRFGELTDTGDERIPVFRVGLTSNTTLRTLNRMICEFYGAIGPSRPSAAELGRIALDRVLACQTRVGVIDDVHFIDQASRDGIAVNNHLKWLANELPITFVFAGVGLEERRFFEEGLTGPSAALAQTARRWTRLSVEQFKPHEHAWPQLVKTIEAHLVLADARAGDLYKLADYLYERTGGHIGSLITLTTRGCYRAIARGEERISRDLLDSIRIDEAAEKARTRLAGAARARR
jgi:hypothetical protein